MSIDTFERTRVHHLTSRFSASNNYRLFFCLGTRALQQKKIFTNWVNAQLDLAEQASFQATFLQCYDNFDNTEDIETRLALLLKHEKRLYRVKDLYNDLSDGRVLLRLLEIFTGRKVG